MFQYPRLGMSGILPRRRDRLRLQPGGLHQLDTRVLRATTQEKPKTLFLSATDGHFLSTPFRRRVCARTRKKSQLRHKGPCPEDLKRLCTDATL